MSFQKEKIQGLGLDIYSLCFNFVWIMITYVSHVNNSIRWSLRLSLRNTNVNFVTKMVNERLVAYAVTGQKKIVLCRNRACKRYGSIYRFVGIYRLISDYLEIVEKEFICCNYCFTYYCSKFCQKQHLSSHSEKCVYSRAISTANQIINLVKTNHLVYCLFTKYLQLHNYSSMSQRGYVELNCPSLSAALKFEENVQLINGIKLDYRTVLNKADDKMKETVLFFRSFVPNRKLLTV